ADVERAARFYDEVLSALGYKRVMEFLPYAIAYGETAPQFWVQLPSDQQSASAGNGTHIAFIARSQAAVRAFYEAAMSAGGRAEGAPGPRPEYSPDYYGGFVRDHDGNKIEAVFYAVADTKPARTRKPAKRKTKAKAKAAAPRKAAKSAKKPAKKSRRSKK